MKAKYSLFAVVTCISMLTSGCSLVREALGTNPRPEPPCNAPSFDLWNTQEVLGPHEPFNIEAHRAAIGTEPTTLDAIAAVAGWRGNWDRMIEVSEHATTEKLVSWPGPASVCWEGLTNDVVWTEGISEGVYLFMDGGDPVQTVHYTGPDKLFFIGKRPPVVLRHDVLTPNGQYLLPPE